MHNKKAFIQATVPHDISQRYLASTRCFMYILNRASLFFCSSPKHLMIPWLPTSSTVMTPPFLIVNNAQARYEVS